MRIFTVHDNGEGLLLLDDPNGGMGGLTSAWGKDYIKEQGGCFKVLLGYNERWGLPLPIRLDTDLLERLRTPCENRGKSYPHANTTTRCMVCREYIEHGQHSDTSFKYAALTDVGVRRDPEGLCFTLPKEPSTDALLVVKVTSGYRGVIGVWPLPWHWPTLHECISSVEWLGVGWEATETKKKNERTFMPDRLLRVKARTVLSFFGGEKNVVLAWTGAALKRFSHFEWQRVLASHGVTGTVRL